MENISSISSGRRRSGRLLRKSLGLQASDPIRTDLSSGMSDCRDINGTPIKRLNIELVPGDERRTLEGLFSDVFDDASLAKVEVEQCISLLEFRVRPLHNFGIQRAVHLLKGESVGSVTGYVCVGKFPVITELPAEYHDQALEYFCAKGRDREASMRYIQSKQIYHVVNGGYEHEGRWRLIESSGYQFTGVEWRTVVIPWQDPKILRSIAMMSSQVQKQTHVVELSFLDEMVHLRRIIDDYILENGLILQQGKSLPRGFCKAIAKVFNGGKDYANNTLRLLISTSAKMGMRTALMMRKIIDEECPRISKSVLGKNSTDESFQLLDTRVFRTLINSKTLRGAKAFFASETTDADRENALYRLRYLAQEMGNYKGVDSVSLDTEVNHAIAARKSLHNFRLRIIGSEAWPEAMKPLQQNMLRTTKLDSEIEANANRPNELLLSLKLKYLRCSGAEGGQKIEHYEKYVADQARLADNNACAELAPGSIEDTDDLMPATLAEDEVHGILDKSAMGDSNDEVLCNSKSSAVAKRNTCGNDETGVQTIDVSPRDGRLHGEETEKESEPDPEPEPEPAKSPLEQCCIELHGLTWEAYNRTVLTEQEIFDFVISDPFQRSAAGSPLVIDCDRRTNLVHFMKKVLVPGGYVFIIVPQLEVASWLTAFEGFEFKLEAVFTLLKDPESVQRVKGKRLQNLIEVAAVAQKGGRHPKKFAMDVISPYTQLPRNRYNRKAPVIDNIAPPRNRLFFPQSRTMVRIGEKPSSLIWELMKTFCPSGGKVLDPFAGTLTTGIACVQSGRSCVLLESDERCLQLGKERLTDIARLKLEQANVGSSILLEPSSDHALHSAEVAEKEGVGSYVSEDTPSNSTNIRITRSKAPNIPAVADEAHDDGYSTGEEQATKPAKETETSSEDTTEKRTLLEPSSVEEGGNSCQTNAEGSPQLDAEISTSVHTAVDIEPFDSPEAIGGLLQIAANLEEKQRARAKNTSMQECPAVRDISFRNSVVAKPTSGKRKKQFVNKNHSSSGEQIQSRPKRSRKANIKYA